MPVGEMWMNAYTAGAQGVPFVFLSGDRAAADEARTLVPDVETVVVKEGLSSHPAGLSVAPAISLSPQKARMVIREAACRAMSKISCIAPYNLAPPFKLRAQFTQTRLADRFGAKPGVRRIDATTLEMDNAEAPWLLM
jgi:D-amino peptidase